MEESLITFETAKLAKEKGFNLKVHNYFSKERWEREFSLKNGFNDDYWGDNWFYDWNTNGEPYKPFSEDCYSIPTQSLLQKWLREVYGIDIWVERWSKNENYIFQCPKLNLQRIFGYYNTYEEALEAGLQEALKLL
jgi:spore maturation protein CgeB